MSLYRTTKSQIYLRIAEDIREDFHIDKLGSAADRPAAAFRMTSRQRPKDTVRVRLYYIVYIVLDKVASLNVLTAMCVCISEQQ